MTNDETTRIAYCPRCDAEREIQITVSWQGDLCIACREDIPE
ncbi:hypothetical protein BDK88_2111 [Natrinema hispanicum]|uniref:Uncharacterized protein n=1 Tax=Natrinema hispanicum TaxID=392421 RepID=A0A482YB14_9EURY|nr:hypothetical protein [Natrinema hispanicum]RZV10905.1 hypothetical protein BDK88_2111 [Natrinema hispanicum]